MLFLSGCALVYSCGNVITPNRVVPPPRSSSRGSALSRGRGFRGEGDPFSRVKARRGRFENGIANELPFRPPLPTNDAFLPVVKNGLFAQGEAQSNVRP